MKGNTRGEGRIHLFEKDGGQIPNKTKMGGVLSKTCDRGRGASRVSIRITFAQFLRNETQYFSFFAHQFCAKKKTIFAIIRKSHFAKNCLIPLLRNSSLAQLRKNQTVGDGVCFLEFNSGKILFWNVFLLVTFT